MKTISSSLLVLALAGCATVEYVPVQQPTKHTITRSPDPAAEVMMQCDSLRMTHPETHRLCVMRGIDRLKIESFSYTLPQAAPIQILPPGHGYPPLSPQFAPYPAYPQCIGCAVPGQIR